MKRVEEKIEAMRKFKPYKYKKIYLFDSVFEDGEKEIKLGYFNMQHMGLMLLTPKNMENSLKIVYDLDCVDVIIITSVSRINHVSENIQKKIVFLYIRKTPSMAETQDLALRFQDYNCIIV